MTRSDLRATARAYAELLRLPAALSVPGDVLLGARATGPPLRGAQAALPVASMCLYWAGMALNDFADRATDARERPERPIPSGRIAPRAALGTAIGLTAAGITLGAWAGGRRRLPAVAALAGAVWAYDLGLKGTRAAPAGMALARGLDVLVGAAPGRRARALPHAGVLALHTYGVTALSRHEVDGATPREPATALLTMGAVTAAALTPAARLRTTNQAPAVLRHGTAAAALTGYAAAYGRPLLRALRAPAAANVRGAVGGGVLGLLPLQAGLLARAGAPGTALTVAGTWPAARVLAKVVSPT